MMQLSLPAFDRSMRSFDVDGRLHVEKTVISIANVCPYYGREISNYQELGLDADKIYQLYRDPDELQKAAPSYHNVPLLEKHIAISAEAPKKDLWVGTVSDISFEYPNLYGSLAVWDRKGIDLIESGEQEQISAGYYFTAIMVPGVARDGRRYDGRMTQLACNHVALVSEGRVGPDSTIADQAPKGIPMPSKFPALAKFLKDDADIAVFDTALQTMFDEAKEAEDAEKQKAEDAAHDFYGETAEDWNTMDETGKQAARDAFEEEEEKKKKAGDKKPGKDKAAKDGEVDHRKDFEGLKDSMISKDELPAILKAQREQIAAETRVANIAREAVRSVVGVVAMDSAEEIYAFALKQMGIKTEGVPPAAFATLFDVAKTRKAAPAQQPAFDAQAFSVDQIWKAA
jgi:hypothetical protein